MSDPTQLMTKRPTALGSPMARLVALLRQFGPYLAIELILPGGSLIALLLWFCRRHGAGWRPVAAARGRARRFGHTCLPSSVIPGGP